MKTKTITRFMNIIRDDPILLYVVVLFIVAVLLVSLEMDILSLIRRGQLPANIAVKDLLVVGAAYQ